MAPIYSGRYFSLIDDKEYLYDLKLDLNELHLYYMPPYQSKIFYCTHYSLDKLEYLHCADYSINPFSINRISNSENKVNLSDEMKEHIQRIIEFIHFV